MYAVAYEIKVSEMNLLYQFDDLVTDQFAYQDSKTFDYLDRLDNNIRAMNRIKTDLVCLLEWNGNDKSPYYLDSADKLQEILIVQYKAFRLQKLLIDWFSLAQEARSRMEKSLIEKMKKEGKLEEKVEIKESNIPDEAKKVKEECRTEFVKLITDGAITSQTIQKDKLTDKFCHKLIKAKWEADQKSVEAVINKFISSFDELKTHLEPITLKINEEFIDEELLEFKIRLGIIDRIPKIQLLTDKSADNKERYVKSIVAKKSGVPFDEKAQPVGEIQVAKVPERASIPTQTIFFAYDKDVYLDYFQGVELVFGPAKKEEKIDKDNSVKTVYTVESQNFIVKFLLKDKSADQKCSKVDFSNCEKVVVICTHFKAKAAGYDNRQKLGNGIHEFVKNLHNKGFNPDTPTDFFNRFNGQIKKDMLDKFDDSVVLLIGDLNSEIDEVAQHLKSKILRLESQVDDEVTKIDETVKETGYKPVKLYFDDVGKEVEISVLPSPGDPKLQLPEKFEIAEDVKSKLLTDFPNYKEPKKGDVEKIGRDMMWIETNNFPTERKIRLKELNYDGKIYSNLINYLKDTYAADKEVSSIPGKYGCFSFLKNE